MPPAGGIVVFAGGFSTAAVEAFRQSLWTSHFRRWSIKHLLRVGHELRTTMPHVRPRFSTAIVERGR
jgi:hypothetical protein